MYRVLVGSIDIRLRGRYSNFYFVLIRTLTGDNPEVSENRVVPLRTPRHVVDVGELRNGDKRHVSGETT